MKNWLASAFSNSYAATAPEVKSSASDTVFAQSSNSSVIALHMQGSADWSGRDYAALSRQGYHKNAVVFRCVRLIAEAAASVPLCARRDQACLADDPANHLMSKGHPGVTREDIMERFYGYLQVSGNAYLEAALVDGVPVALYALRPDKMRAKTDRKGWPSGWEYEAGGYKRSFRRDVISGRCAVHHMKSFDPLDELYGFAPLSAAADAVDIHNAGGRWTKALLDNAARPSGALIYKGASGTERLSDDQFERLKSELQGAHSGAGNAGRPMVLEGGLDWKAMSFSPADMDFIDARREAAREIALAFGVPPMLLGIPGDNTYANYKEANLAFWRQTIIPLVSKTANGLTQWLQPFFGDDLTIAADLNAVPALSEERAVLWKRLSDASFLSDTERREMAGLVAGHENHGEGA